MKTKYDDTYDVVVTMAKIKMKMNSHKGDIESCAFDELIRLAGEELIELEQAIIASDNQLHVIEEVADTLNFTVAAAHKAIESYRTRK